MTDNTPIEPMKSYLYSLPDQFSHCLGMSYEEVGRLRRPFKQVVVSGLGGSAIGGDILRTYAFPRALIPILVNRDYHLPGFVDENTLFIAVSYSGNTEETLQAYDEAKSRQAQILAISSGGELSKRAEADGYAVVTIPGGLSPRAASGFLLTPLLLSLESLGILSDVKGDIAETVTILKNLRDVLKPSDGGHSSPAQAIAQAMKGGIPVIWGSVNRTEAAALRWKAQINENSKSPAYYNVFPELNHNEIVGFEDPDVLLAQLVIIILKDRYDYERVQQRMRVTQGLIEKKVKKVIEVESAGESLLARLYSLIYIGDYVSFYLALEYGTDPTPVKAIDYLKEELAKI